MKQFDLSLWLQDKSRKVITRNNIEVEIIHDSFPLVAIINGVAYNFDNDGKFQSNKTNHKYDLFFADEKEEPQSIEIPFGAKDSEFIKDEYYIPEGCEARIEGNKVIIEKIQEEELTEFEKELINLVFKYKYWDSSKDKVKQDIKKDSKLLLDLARKELISIQDTKAYQEGVKEGRRLEREDLEEFIEDKVAEKFAELLKNIPIQSPLQPNPYNPNPFQPTTVLYGCPSTQSDVIYGTKIQQDNE